MPMIEVSQLNSDFVKGVEAMLGLYEEGKKEEAAAQLEKVMDLGVSVEQAKNNGIESDAKSLFMDGMGKLANEEGALGQSLLQLKNSFESEDGDIVGSMSSLISAMSAFKAESEVTPSESDESEESEETDEESPEETPEETDESEGDETPEDTSKSEMIWGQDMAKSRKEDLRTQREEGEANALAQKMNKSVSTPREKFSWNNVKNGAYVNK